MDISETGDDVFTWKLEASGIYSASSAYRLQFMGSTSSPIMKSVWRAWAPSKIKLFSWLLSIKRLLTADRLMARAWPNSYFCPLCWRSLGTADHLFRECPWSMQLWEMAAGRFGIASFLPSSWRPFRATEDWLEDLSSGSSSPRRARSIALLIVWSIWLERNGRIFKEVERPIGMVFEWITDELATWVQAGGRHLMPRE